MTEAVDVVNSNGVTGISWVFSNEWTEYTVTVAASGSYTANFRVGSPGAGQKVVLTVDGAPGCTVDIPSTGSYNVYTTVSAPLSLSAGTHVIRLTYLVGGYGENVDWFEIIRTTATPVPTTVPTTQPITNPTSVTGTIGPTMNSAQAASTASAASSAAYQRLASKQAAHRAWAVPAPSQAQIAAATNARVAGLKSDGVTENTAALQALLTASPAGATIYFPAGTYRISGPIRITKPVTLLGEAGTVFNCQRATQNVFSINAAGTATSRLSGVTITGVVIEGPGVETNPIMVYGKYVQNMKVSNVKFHNVGYAAIGVFSTTDMVVENCVFDNVFQTGLGYGVMICDHSDRITIRNNFFVTKGRHSVATGTATTNLPEADWVRSVLVENNYIEETTQSAIDTHPTTIGPLVVRNNVIYHCLYGVQPIAGTSEITDNVIIGDGSDLYKGYAGITMLDSRVNKVLRNTIIAMTHSGVQMERGNGLVQDNIIIGTGYNGVVVYSNLFVPTQIRIERNIIKGWDTPINILRPYSSITQANNYIL